MNPLANDLDYILEQTAPLWESLRNQRIFITGGTGFFGCWLLESFLWANLKFKLNATAVVLTRNRDIFIKKWPHLCSSPFITFHEGDTRNFLFPSGEFSHIIHAATDVSHPGDYESIVQGVRHVLAFSKACHANKFLLTSSGAVYGKQPADILYLSEDMPFYDTHSAYALGKREAEKYCFLFSKQHNLQIKIARCFAFVGPYLPLNTHFAIGNFIRDGLASQSITVNGNGTAYRSYMYAADLMVWLWTILFRGEVARPYNVGSDHAINIAELAEIIAGVFNPKLTVSIKQALCLNLPAERYIPSIQRAKNELGLNLHTNLISAIQATINWQQQCYQ